jgi:hypothetical protein
MRTRLIVVIQCLVLLFRIREVPVANLGRNTAILTKAFRNASHSHQTNTVRAA